MSVNMTDLMPSVFTSSAANNGTTPFVENGFASTGFIIFCTSLVLLMTPAVGLLYSGLSQSKNGLSILLICMLTYSVVTVQWVAFGHSFAFSETGSAFLGNFAHAGLAGIGSQGLMMTAPAIPAALFSAYQLQFAALTAAIIFGSVVERVRILPCLIFIFIWTTVIYDPLAYWTWGARGWLKNMSCIAATALDQTPCFIGLLDFAGGVPVEICSGASGLALSVIVGRRNRRRMSGHSAHNMVNVFIATGLLFFGWIGFNGGSALNSTPRAALSVFNTCISAAIAGLSWVLLDIARGNKITGIGYCSGVLSGLVCITPGCGFVPLWAAAVIGFFGGLIGNFGCVWKEYLGIDDTLDAFGIHGVCGFFGLLFTGLFASPEIAAMDGTVILGGAIYGNWTQLGYQAAGAVSALVYSFMGTLILAWGFDKIPGLHFRSTEDEELKGLDISEMGEVSYEMIVRNHSLDEKAPLSASPTVTTIEI